MVTKVIFLGVTPHFIKFFAISSDSDRFAKARKVGP